MATSIITWLASGRHHARVVGGVVIECAVQQTGVPRGGAADGKSARTVRAVASPPQHISHLLYRRQACSAARGIDSLPPLAFALAGLHDRPVERMSTPRAVPVAVKRSP